MSPPTPSSSLSSSSPSSLFSSSIAAAAADIGKDKKQNNNNAAKSSLLPSILLSPLASLLIGFAIPYLYSHYQNRKKGQRFLTKNNKNDESNNDNNVEDSNYSNIVRPPFPKILQDALLACTLAYLSTVDHNTSHLSLMRFTYLANGSYSDSNDNVGNDKDVIILSTNRHTKKYEMLQKQNGFALLVHDFRGVDHDGEKYDIVDDKDIDDNNIDDSSQRGLYSITLNGNCRIVEEGMECERYRKAHLKHNPDYPQFIVGNDIAILCVTVTSARICNIKDHVTKWSVHDNNNEHN